MTTRPLNLTKSNGLKSLQGKALLWYLRVIHTVILNYSEIATGQLTAILIYKWKDIKKVYDHTKIMSDSYKKVYSIFARHKNLSSADIVSILHLTLTLFQINN